MMHELKCWPVYYEKVYQMNKNFEIRKNDRDFKVGDILHLNEWDEGSKEYTGRHCFRTVMYILHEYEGLKEGFVIMQLDGHVQKEIRTT